jgi:hypothetical protein
MPNVDVAHDDDVSGLAREPLASDPDGAEGQGHLVTGVPLERLRQVGHDRPDRARAQHL